MTTTAIDWVRGKARIVETSSLEVDGVTYRVTRSAFRGTLPVRMARELARSELIKSETVLETVHVGGEYRSQAGRCEYIRAVYEPVQAA